MSASNCTGRSSIATTEISRLRDAGKLLKPFPSLQRMPHLQPVELPNTTTDADGVRFFQRSVGSFQEKYSLQSQGQRVYQRGVVTSTVKILRGDRYNTTLSTVASPEPSSFGM